MGGPPAMPTVQATVPALSPPSWAVLQRHLFDVLNASEQPMAFVEIEIKRPEALQKS